MKELVETLRVIGGKIQEEKGQTNEFKRPFEIRYGCDVFKLLKSRVVKIWKKERLKDKFVSLSSFSSRS